MELEWFEANKRDLGQFSGLWIAIKGRRVIASSDDLGEILAWLSDQRVVDALVVPVPDDVLADQYIIAT